MTDTATHWNRIYATQDQEQLGWYEDDVAQSVKFVQRANLTPVSRVFIAGAGASKLVDHMAEQGYTLVVNDISLTALNVLKERLGAANAEYLVHDLGKPLARGYETDLWIDRAVLHFLREETQIGTYVENLRRCVKPGGHVLLAEFSTEGAEKCAGLAVHRYSLEEMQRRLGNDFIAVTSENFVFTNPFGQAKPYLYALFRRSEI